MHRCLQEKMSVSLVEMSVFTVVSETRPGRHVSGSQLPTWQPLGHPAPRLHRAKNVFSVVFFCFAAERINPELNQKGYSVKSDIWSLGITMVACDNNCGLGAGGWGMKLGWGGRREQEVDA